jgi:hypothetical protein
VISKRLRRLCQSKITSIKEPSNGSSMGFIPDSFSLFLV